MNLTDSVRISILEALLKKNAVIPNLRQIKRYTGFHKATIKSSLEFMHKEGLLSGFGPKIDLRKLGYNLEVISMWHADVSRKEIFERLKEVENNDPHVYRFASIIGPGNWNLVTRQIFKDVESYHQWLRNKYYEAVPGINDFIKDRQIFYEIEPHYKAVSRTGSIIRLIKMEKGLE